MPWADLLSGAEKSKAKIWFCISINKSDCTTLRPEDGDSAWRSLLEADVDAVSVAITSVLFAVAFSISAIDFGLTQQRNHSNQGQTVKIKTTIPRVSTFAALFSFCGFFPF